MERSEGLMRLMFRKEMVRCGFNLGSGVKISKRIILWSEMGNSA